MKLIVRWSQSLPRRSPILELRGGKTCGEEGDCYGFGECSSEDFVLIAGGRSPSTCLWWDKQPSWGVQQTGGRMGGEGFKPLAASVLEHPAGSETGCVEGEEASTPMR